MTSGSNMALPSRPLRSINQTFIVTDEQTIGGFLFVFVFYVATQLINADCYLNVQGVTRDGSYEQGLSRSNMCRTVNVGRCS